MVLGPITFLAPLALLGLLALPVIWWILRITPPKPIRQVFPPLRLFKDIEKEEETPNSTPPWLLLFRLLMGALLAISLAKPVLFNPESAINRPQVLVIDNSWAAAGNWSSVLREAEAAVNAAMSANQLVAIQTTANLTANTPPSLISPTQALGALKSLQPTPYQPDRNAAAKAIETLEETHDIIWLSDGINYGNAQAMKNALSAAASAKLYIPNAEISPILAGGASEAAEGFRNTWHRIDTSALRALSISAYDASGRVIATAPLNFAPGAKTAEAEFELPAELRNRVSSLRADGYLSAGAVHLLDDSWGRPLVGLLQGSDANSLPLLSEWHYIEKALAPSADIYKGDLEQLLAVSPSIIFMTDRARTESEELDKYVEDGGLLVRFAGPVLAKRPDGLIPVTIREGGRDLGGALAWEEPQELAPFANESPFLGLDQREDINVRTQIMAAPGAQTDASTWARLEDGSPVITSAPRGLGRVILFHVTAGPEWSDLPLSGLYVDMLKRILPLARARAAAPQTSAGDWTPERTLDGYGQLKTPPVTARPIANAAFATTRPGPAHPPGLYRQGMRRQALNTAGDPDQYTALSPGAYGAAYGGAKPRPLSGILLAIAAMMLAIDALLSIAASGRFGRQAWRQTAALLIAAALLGPALVSSATAQTAKPGYSDALDLHLAYVITGNPGTDKLSKAGLEGLAAELAQRTTIEPAGVRGVDVERDELAYYPFLYWPVLRTAEPLSEKAALALNAYMAGGGTIVFDTLDNDRQKLLGNQPHPGLTAISENLDIPRLSHPPADHVITKSFYLLQVFPGRYADGKIWVAADQRGTARDGVSAVIVGSNDWASAWAKTADGRNMTVIDSDIPRQREMAYRFGVNLAMYSMAGNYKADQVHAETLLKRIGRNSDRNIAPDVRPLTPETQP